MDLTSILLGLSSGAVVPIVLELIRRKSKKQIDSEVDVDIAKAAESIASGSSSVVETLEKLLTRYDKKIDEQQTQIEDQQTKITNQSKAIGNLQARISAIQLAEKERDRIDTERNNTITEFFEAFLERVETLTTILREHEIPVPEPQKKIPSRDTLELIKSAKGKKK